VGSERGISRLPTGRSPREIIMKKVKMKRIGPVVVLSPQASLFGGDETYALKDAIQQLNDEGNQYLVVNLAKVERMTSLGLGFLVAGHKLYHDRGASMTLCCLRPSPDYVIAITKLAQVFDIYDTEEEAIAGFIEEKKAEKTEEVETPPSATQK
jgi:anti-sigma B factor antagonist